MHFLLHSLLTQNLYSPQNLNPLNLLFIVLSSNPIQSNPKPNSIPTIYSLPTHILNPLFSLQRSISDPLFPSIKSSYTFPSSSFIHSNSPLAPSTLSIISLTSSTRIFSKPLLCSKPYSTSNHLFSPIRDYIIFFLITTNLGKD